MKNKKNYFKLKLFVLSVILLNFSAFAKAETPQAKTQNSTQYLFVQTADTGELIQLHEKSRYKLVLTHVDPDTTYFSNVPISKTGYIDSLAFIKLLDNEVKLNYPNGLNAGIVLHRVNDQKPIHYAFALKNPVYDEAADTMTYMVAPLSGHYKTPLPVDLKFNHIALFVDSMGVCASCGGEGF